MAVAPLARSPIIMFLDIPVANVHSLPTTCNSFTHSLTHSLTKYLQYTKAEFNKRNISLSYVYFKCHDVHPNSCNHSNSVLWLVRYIACTTIPRSIEISLQYIYVIYMFRYMLCSHARSGQLLLLIVRS